jgi:hypothetical protein
MSENGRAVRRQQFAFMFSRLAEGPLRRKAVAEQFQVSITTASAVFSEFQHAYPGAMKYDELCSAYVQGYKFLDHYRGATEAAAAN